MSATIPGPDGQPRCQWAGSAPEFMHYHDTEWGFPVDNDQRLYEKICLEGFQSGLSWRTILAKREAFRTAFHQFDFDQVAQFTEHDVERLLQNKAIVRHRGKINAAINNAKRTQELIRQEGSLAAYIWQYEPDPTRLAPPQSVTTCPEAIALSKDLKKRGWKFVGPTTVYAFMQAMGLINDHVAGCALRQTVTDTRKSFVKPKPLAAP